MGELSPGLLDDGLSLSAAVADDRVGCLDVLICLLNYGLESVVVGFDRRETGPSQMSMGRG
ncbi:hypothetical protein, partial [Kocuria marina]|uniref:hypothetical protein n=1 Tax=Kocuria marina TaxID=223184 RepID=UPI0022DFE80E